MRTKKEMTFGVIIALVLLILAGFGGYHYITGVVKTVEQKRIELSAQKIAEGLNGAQTLGQNINLDLFSTGEEIVKRAYEPLPGPKGTIKLRLDPPVEGVEKLLDYDGERNIVRVLPYIPPR